MEKIIGLDKIHEFLFAHESFLAGNFDRLKDAVKSGNRWFVREASRELVLNNTNKLAELGIKVPGCEAKMVENETPELVEHYLNSLGFLPRKILLFQNDSGVSTTVVR